MYIYSTLNILQILRKIIIHSFIYRISYIAVYYFILIFDFQLVYNTLEYSGVNTRQSNLFDREAVAKITKKLFKGLSGVDNIYTQHTPLLNETLEDLIKGRLSLHTFPYLGNMVMSRR